MKRILLILCLAVVPVFAFGATSAHKHNKVWSDSTRLAALLSDVQHTGNFEPATWKVVANEANTLANRIYAGSAGNKTARSAAKDLRTHVRQMRESAMSGDASGARQHAGEAQPFVYQLIDWSM
jgi:hypothetical protein